MKSKMFTGVAVKLLIYLIVFFSGLPGVLSGAVVLLGALGIYEIYRAAGIGNDRKLLILSVLFSAAITYLPVPHYEFILNIVFWTAITISGFLMYCLEYDQYVNSMNGMVVALIYILLLKAVPFFREITNGPCYLAISVTVFFLTRDFEYLGNRCFGRNNVLPKVIPKKTAEGAIIGLVYSTILALLVGSAIRLLGIVKVDMIKMTAYVLCASVFGQFGDMSISAVKRIYGIENFGNVLPGCEGVLDRFGGLIFIVSYTMLFVTLTGGYLS